MTGADWRRWAGHRLAQLAAGVVIGCMFAIVWLWRPAGDPPDRPGGVPAFASIQSARFYEGEPLDAPMRPLDLKGNAGAAVEQLLAWWRGGEVVPAESAEGYPLANELRLQTTDGSLITLQAAHDCQPAVPAGQVALQCRPAAGVVRTWVDGEVARVRSPELHRWLVSGWAEVVGREDVLAGLDGVPGPEEIDALQLRPGGGGAVHTLPAGASRNDALISNAAGWLLEAVAEGPDPHGSQPGAPTLVVRIGDGTALEIVRASDCSGSACAPIPGYVAVTRVPEGDPVRAWAPELAKWLDGGMVAD